MPPSVCVTIVTYKARKFIETCLESVLQQSFPVEVVVVDNACMDGTRPILAGYEDRIRVIYNNENVGFAAAQNQAIAASTSEWVLALNPDVVLLPGFIEQLVEGGRIDSNVGTVCGRLLSMERDLKVPEHPLIDSAGIYFTPSMRHFDRGWHEPDDGRFRQIEYVFGASAAAALYRREMIREVSGGAKFFAPDSFAYREDADVRWRGHLPGRACSSRPNAPPHPIGAPRPRH